MITLATFLELLENPDADPKHIDEAFDELLRHTTSIKLKPGRWREYELQGNGRTISIAFARR